MWRQWPGRGGSDRSRHAQWGRRSRGSPFTYPRGSMAAHAPARGLATPATTPQPAPRPSPHPTCGSNASPPTRHFQIRPLNRLAAIQFAVLKAIKLG